MATKTVDEVGRSARKLIAEIGAAMGAQMAELVDELHGVLAEASEEISGDQQMLDLLHTSIESNLETLVHIVRPDIPIEEVTSPERR